MDASADNRDPSLQRWSGDKKDGVDPTVRRPIELPRDVTIPPATLHAIRLLSTENPVLNLIATDRPLDEILDALVCAIENHCVGATASVLLMSDDGRRLRHGAAPGLPEGYMAAVDGVRIGPAVGSCGTAAHRGERVIVSDTANDPLWADFAALVEQYQIRACWSQPIFSASHEVLGTFAMYYNQPREPNALDLEYVEVAAHLAGIAIARDRAERSRQAENRWRHERSTALVQLAKSDSLTACDFQAFARQATEVAAKFLPVQRVGVWLFNRDHSMLRCQDLYELSLDNHTEGTELRSEYYPRYFAALERGRAVVAHDALDDPDTSEFTERYLTPNNITSMLDAPIRGPDGLAGVVCHEHVGPARVWTSNEQDFAAAIADLVSLSSESSKRRLAEHAYRAADRRLLQSRESELAKARSDFTRLFELSLDLLCVAGMDGYLRRVNPAFEQILGYTEYELMAEPFLRFVHPDDHQITRRELESLGKGVPTIGFLNRCCCKDGSYRWLEWSAVSVPQDGALYAVARDLTDRRKSEEQLRQLSKVVEQTDDAVIITDRAGRISYVNRAFELTTCYSRDEVLGKTPRILKSGKQSEDYYTKLWEMILRGETHRGEVVNRKKTGRLYYAEQTITPIKEPDGRVTRFVSVMKDMTERRQSQRMELEMELAARVQRRLYPENPPQLDGFDVAGAVFPAQATCGDYFDFIVSEDRSLRMAVGDVCGHGFGSALLMSETRAYLQTLARTQSDMAAIFASINGSLSLDLDDHHYVTLILASLDAAAGRLSWVNAGHIPGYVLHRTGAIKTELGSCGFPLGMFAGSKYPVGQSVAIEPGEVIVLLTDGITELEDRSGDYFGELAVLEVLKAHIHEPAEQMVVRVREAAEHFAKGQTPADDMTIVICKRLPVD